MSSCAASSLDIRNTLSITKLDTNRQHVIWKDFASTNKSPMVRKYKQAIHWLCHDDGLGIGAKKNLFTMCDQSNEKREREKARSSSEER